MDLEETLNLKKNQYINSNTIMEKFLENNIEKSLLSSGLSNFDNVLGGGFCPGKMYLIFGANTTGKTQLCHQISVQSTKNSKIVYYLDSESTFRAERIREMSIAQNLEPDKVLKNIFVSK